jgi:hypothetical protein
MKRIFILALIVVFACQLSLLGSEIPEMQTESVEAAGIVWVENIEEVHDVTCDYTSTAEMECFVIHSNVITTSEIMRRPNSDRTLPLVAKNDNKNYSQTIYPPMIHRKFG